MNKITNHNEIIAGIILNIIISFLIATPFALIDINTAFFVGSIITSIILIRKAIRYLVPQHVNGYRNQYSGKELSIPKNVEVFEITNSASKGILYKYIGLMEMMAIRPKVLILRFENIIQIEADEAHILDEVITRLSGNEINICFSGVGMSLKRQMNQLGIGLKIAEENIFYSFADALNRCKQILKHSVSNVQIERAR